MRARADVEIAVLSQRFDLDLVISTRLPGYVAQRVDEADAVIAITERGGIVLMDLASSEHQAWLDSLQSRGFDGPLVFLHQEGDLTIDLSDSVAVPSPSSLSDLLSAFETVRPPLGQARRRGGAATPARVSPPAALHTPTTPEAFSTARAQTTKNTGDRPRRSDRRRDVDGSSPWRRLRAGRTTESSPASGLRARQRRVSDGSDLGSELFAVADANEGPDGPVGQDNGGGEAQIARIVDEELFLWHPDLSGEPPPAEAVTTLWMAPPAVKRVPPLLPRMVDVLPPIAEPKRALGSQCRSGMG